jgi:hypothetical protein
MARKKPTHISRQAIGDMVIFAQEAYRCSPQANDACLTFDLRVDRATDYDLINLILTLQTSGANHFVGF